MCENSVEANVNPTAGWYGYVPEPSQMPPDETINRASRRPIEVQVVPSGGLSSELPPLWSREVVDASESLYSALVAAGRNEQYNLSERGISTKVRIVYQEEETIVRTTTVDVDAL